MTDDPFKIAHEAYQRAGMVVGPTMRVSTAPLAEGRSGDLSVNLWVCGICNTQVNRLTSPDGKLVWLHARSWQRYDHDPKPVEVPREQVKLSLCDFCGEDGEQYWSFEGDVVEQATGNTRQNFGHLWSACKHCSPYVDNADIEGLASRVMRVSALGRNRKRSHRDEIRRSTVELQGRFIRTIRRKKYIGPKIEPVEIKPRHLPKIKDGLLRFWRHPDLYDMLGNKPQIAMSVPGVHAGNEDLFMQHYYDGQAMGPDVFTNHAHHIAAGLGVDDTMYWISEDFTSLATIAGQDLTSSIELTRENLPSPFGLLVWARPIGEIPRPHGMASIRAVSWTLVPGGLWINLYILADDADPELTDLVSYRAEWGHLKALNVGSGLAWGVDEPIPDEIRNSGGGYILTTLATWFLMAQPGVADQIALPNDKAMVRSYKRSGKKPPDVRIVDLRRHARAKPETTEERVHRSPTVRFMVRGHWRNQAYGPKRGLRRPLYISPFIKGPEDAPLKSDVQTVRVLR